MIDRSITLQNIQTDNIVSVAADLPLSQGVQLMAKHKISCLVVTEKNNPVGILTERDMVRLATVLDRQEHRRMDEVMSRQLITAPQSMDYREGFELLAANAIRHLVILDEQGQLSGIVTETDILRHMGVEYFLQHKELGSIMTRKPVCLGMDCLVAEAIETMAKNRISCIVVEQDDYPAGIITERDAVRLFNEGCDIRAIRLEQVMSHPVHTLTESTGAHEVAMAMKSKGVRRLVVVDENGQMVGLVTEHDVVKGVQGKFVDHLKNIIERQADDLSQIRHQLNQRTVLDNLLQSSSELAIIGTDLDCRITYWNTMAEKILALSATEAYEHNLINILSECHLDSGIFKFGIRLVPGSGSYEYPITRTHGEIIEYFDARVFGIWNENNRLAGFVLTLKDVTSEQATREALRESEARLNSMFRNAAAGMAGISSDGRFTRCNPELCRMLGYSETELLQITLFDIIHPDDLDTTLKQLQQTVSGAAAGYQLERRYLRKDGSCLWCLVSLGLIRDEAGKTSSGVALFQDITEKKQLDEQRRIMADEQRDTLIREVHHRIKNHLQGVIGLLRLQLTSKSDISEMIAGAIGQVETIAVVHGVLGRRQDRDLKPAELFESIVASVESLTTEKVEWQCASRPGPDCCIVQDKAVAIALVANELLVNATKHRSGENAPSGIIADLNWNGNELLLQVSNPGHLPIWFDFDAGAGLGTGLELIRSMLPSQGTRLTFEEKDGWVTVRLNLAPPVIFLQ
ncbi:MAG: CBS domain-containing protein [Pseudomonadota bacterium]